MVLSDGEVHFAEFYLEQLIIFICTISSAFVYCTLHLYFSLPLSTYCSSFSSITFFLINWKP